MKKLREVTVEIIQKCNSNCIFCSSLSNLYSSIKIPLNKLKEISTFSYENGINTINISGGEPLLYENLVNYLKYNEIIGIKSNIYTSGNIKNFEILDEIISSKLNNNKINFIINYPSFDNNIFQKLINSSEYSTRSINNFIKKLIFNNYNVEAHIVPNELNINSLFKTIKYLKKIGIKRVSLLRLVLQGRAEENAKILKIKNNKKIEELFKLIKEELDNNNFRIRVGIPFSNLLNLNCQCLAGSNKLIFKYDGNVFPCEAFKEVPNNQKYILGNIYKDSLETIWNNHPVQQILLNLKKEAILKNEPCPAQLLYSAYF